MTISISRIFDQRKMTYRIAYVRYTHELTSRRSVMRDSERLYNRESRGLSIMNTRWEIVFRWQRASRQAAAAFSATCVWW